MRRFHWLLAAFLLFSAGCGAIQGDDSTTLAEGAGSFSFSQPEAVSGQTLTVHYYKPENAGNKPGVVFVMHGMSRNADDYRDRWIKFADKYGLVILSPCFDREQFPTYREYNLGNMLAKDGSRLPEKDWSFAVIEAVFDRVRRENQFVTERYYLFGHSAGAQFVHRFVLFMPKAKCKMAIAANAGWYTMPDFKVKFPYGLAGSGLGNAGLDQALGRRLRILLGDKDNDPQGKNLRKTREAKAQGPHRLARGKAFYAEGKRLAAKDKVPFGWSLQTVPGVAHSSRGMSPPAARIIHEDMVNGGE